MAEREVMEYLNNFPPSRVPALGAQPTHRSGASPEFFDARREVSCDVRIVYDVPEDSRPIVIHYLGLNTMCSEVLWRRPDNKVWKEYIYDGCDGGYGLAWDDPDKEIHIVGDKCFYFLRPGQSIDTTYSLDADEDYSLPPDLEPGDEVRYQYKGGTIDWWDWGTVEDHKDTKVTVKGIVYTWLAKPNDNDGRPRIEVPASNVVQFRIV